MRQAVRFLMTLALATCLHAQGVGPELKEFLSWYETYQGSFMPPDVMKAYRARLTEQGLNDEQAQARLGAVQKAIGAMPREFTSLHFNKIYSSPNPPFRLEPSAFLVKLAADLKPGAALDVAMGQGRNAVYLATRGWQVTGYDLSPKGLEVARAAAEKAGKKLETVVASHAEFDYGKEKWDLIVETYAFTDLHDAAYRKRIVDALKPGGMLLIEGFSGGPKNGILEGFHQLRVVYFEDRQDIADWSMQKMRLTRLAAVKD